MSNTQTLQQVERGGEEQLVSTQVQQNGATGQDFHVNQNARGDVTPRVPLIEAHNLTVTDIVVRMQRNQMTLMEKFMDKLRSAHSFQGKIIAQRQELHQALHQALHQEIDARSRTGNDGLARSLDLLQTQTNESLAQFEGLGSEIRSIEEKLREAQAQLQTIEDDMKETNENFDSIVER